MHHLACIIEGYTPPKTHMELENEFGSKEESPFLGGSFFR